MRLIGAGWGRTGTTSLAAALDRLGVGPCLQMQEMWAHPDLADVWNEHHDGAPVDWRSVLKGWRSTVDWPGCWQWQDFARIWPDAPILLSVRPSDEWYDSVRASIHAWTAPGKDIGPPPVTALLNRVWEEDFGGWECVLDRGHAIACYERHNQSVRASCPPERLVEWTVIDGWRPLCRALNLAVPDEPFPHLNKR
ncbi:sulfotransferase family protein [Micromonospora sp. NPDC000442]|uniref:sulfotransferase family protein n=1 Tax=Micromonospora sp. NPDC000442 TaxID=3364217 RepID=UPI00367516ED